MSGYGHREAAVVVDELCFSLRGFLRSSRAGYVRRPPDGR